MSDGITDAMREQERINKEIFEHFHFEESPIDGHMYLPIHEDVSICWDYNYEYWYIDIKGRELKIYPESAKDIDSILNIYTRNYIKDKGEADE